MSTVLPGAGRGLRSAAATASLLAASVAPVHLVEDLTEAHSHVVVMVGLAALYQTWVPRPRRRRGRRRRPRARRRRPAADTVSRRIQGCVRSTDQVARLGVADSTPARDRSAGTLLRNADRTRTPPWRCRCPAEALLAVRS
ncbi:hypothetical protein [Geodermatophilus siccatus]|uniref:hypothetical protein n=1 Tax=Geodermatophilus siccatus TaxID=1137991 RepID=UPI000B89BA25|nr:hypothetical protein [Geodermatophilus siccatus]